MKAFVTSIGEKTTSLCVNQLKRLGYDVVLLDRNEPWVTKYKRFLELADNNCLRVDADVIVNENLSLKNLEQITKIYQDRLMIQFQIFDLYSLDIRVGQPIYYHKAVFKKIKENLGSIDSKRPESWAWRLPVVNKNTSSCEDRVCGVHGFWQTNDDMARAIDHRKERDQKDVDYSFIWDLHKII